MTTPPRSMTVIESELQHLKGIRELCSDEDVMACLQDSQETLNIQTARTFQRSLIHYAAVADGAELLYLPQDGTAKLDLD